MSSDRDPAENPHSDEPPRPPSWEQVSSVIDEPVRHDEVGASTVEVEVPEQAAPAPLRPSLDPHGTSKPSIEPERAAALAAKLAEPAVPTAPAEPETPVAAPPPPPARPTTARPDAPTPTQVVDASVPPRDALRWQPGEIKLVIEQGLSIGKEFLVSDDEMLVGRRDPDQDFIPDIDLFDQEAANNRYISRRQARLFFRDAQLFLEDLESSNGTAINNRLIAAHEPRQLKLNDKLLFGQSVLLRVKRV